MENLIYSDTRLFFLSIGLGLLAGLYYELFRLLRLALPHGAVLCGLEDLLFFLPVTFVFLVFTYVFSDGIVRWFSVAGLGAGFLLYLGTVGKVVHALSGRIIRFIRRLLRLVLRITLLPLYNVFKNITNHLFNRIQKRIIILKERRRIARFEKEKKRLISFAEKGF